MTKAKTKAQRRREKAVRTPATPDSTPTLATQARASHTARPTPERWHRGTWHEPQGTGRGHKPLMDVASDLIGKLHAEGKITSSQHEAASRFKELREALLQDMGVAGYRSCLAGGSGGHDSGDGDVSIADAYRAVSKQLGPHLRPLVLNVHKLADEPVTNLPGLRIALNVLVGAENNG